MIEFYNEDIDFPDVNVENIVRWIGKIIYNYSRIEGDLTFIFCSDNYLLEINKQYLQHDYFTDIITFNYNENEVISGDIFISLDTVKSNAEEYKVTFFNELLRVIVHGILHLIGFDDKTSEQKKIMREKENEALNLFHL